MDVIWLHAGKLLGDLFNIPIDAGKKDLDPGLATRVQAELQVLISYLVKTGQIIKLPAKPPESPGDRENPNTDQESAEWQSAWENKRFDVLKVSADRIDLVKALATINQLGEKEVKSCQLTP